MPRLSKTVPSYRKHKASGQAFVELNGHRHYLGPHGTKTSQAEYDRLIAKWLDSGRKAAVSSFAPASIDADGFTVAELVAKFMSCENLWFCTGGSPPER